MSFGRTRPVFMLDFASLSCAVVQGAMLVTTFLIQSPELSALNSTAQQDVLADMFDSVLGNATVQFSIAGAVPGAPDSLSVRFNATLPQDEVSSISNGSCCDQYAAALQAAMKDTSEAMPPSVRPGLTL